MRIPKVSPGTARLSAPLPRRPTRPRSRRAAAVAAALLALTSAAACASNGGGGKPGSGGSGDAAHAKIAFLMPDLASTRYEQFDSPLFKKRMKQLCPGCSVQYSNAKAKSDTQQDQANSALAQGVKALVIDPVDSAAAASVVRAAKAQHVAVVAYDRPIPKEKADFYVSFDNEKIGRMISTSLVDHLKKTGAKGGVLEVNGSPTDAAAGLIKKGIHEGLKGSPFPTLAEFDAPDWDPAKAQNWTDGQITAHKKQIVGVVAANDGTASGAIAAFKAAGVKPVPPTTGNDAELAAAQRIVTGDQYNTISKPLKIVADDAAQVTWQLINGKQPKPTATLFGTPSHLFTPTVVTAANVQSALTAKGPFTVAQICTAQYKAACDKAGIH